MSYLASGSSTEKLSGALSEPVGNAIIESLTPTRSIVLISALVLGKFMPEDRELAACHQSKMNCFFSSSYLSAALVPDSSLPPCLDRGISCRIMRLMQKAENVLTRFRHLSLSTNPLHNLGPVSQQNARRNEIRTGGQDAWHMQGSAYLSYISPKEDHPTNSKLCRVCRGKPQQRENCTEHRVQTRLVSRTTNQDGGIEVGAVGFSHLDLHHVYYSSGEPGQIVC